MALNSLKIGIRKIVSLVSVLVLVLALVPTYAFATSGSSIDSQTGTNLIASGRWGTCPWEINMEGTLIVRPGTGEDTPYTRDWVGGCDIYNYHSPWDEYKSNVKKVVFLETEGVHVTAPKVLNSLFEGFSSLVSADLSGLDLKQTKVMKNMFQDCSSLVDVNWTSYGPVLFQSAEKMFYNCSSLVTLDLSKLPLYFGGYSESADKQGFGTLFGLMFAGCSSLMDLNISRFSTVYTRKVGGYVKYFYPGGAFDGCDSLIRISVGSDFVLDEASRHGTNQVFADTDWLSASTGEIASTSDLFSPRGRYVTKGTYSGYYVSDSDTDWGNLAGGGTYINLNPSVAPPLITEGKNLNWVAEGENGARFRSDAPIQVFENVKVDGTVLDEADYELMSGSTAVTLTPSYLSTLSLGEHTIDITSLNGTASTTFTITKSLESSAELNLSQEKFLYDGTQKKPAVTVKAGDAVLLEGVDYEVSYPDIPVAVGTYTATITGKGNYSGTKTISYEIVPAAITSIALDATKFTHDGTQKRPAVTVKCGDKTLVEGTDYAVTYPISSSAVGTYTMTVAGKGNYTGTKQATFEIVEASKPTPDEPKPGDPGSIDPKPDDPGTHPDNPGTTDPAPGNPGTQPEDPGTTDPQPDDPGASDPAPGDADRPGAGDPEPVATQVMYRLYNPNSGEHFYTASRDEREHLRSVGWEYEGHAWTAPATSATPVYRLYSGTDHHYTTSAFERDELVKVGWSDEGIGWYSDDSQGVGLHRLFNPNVDPKAKKNNSGSHHYTTSEVERDHLVSIGWRYEEFGWYGVG